MLNSSIKPVFQNTLKNQKSSFPQIDLITLRERKRHFRKINIWLLLESGHNVSDIRNLHQKYSEMRTLQSHW